MFDITVEDQDLNEAIASAHADLKSFSADEEGYQKAVDQLSKLYALKTQNAQLRLQAQQTYAAHQLATEELNHRVENEAAAMQLAQDQNAWQEEQDQRPFYARVSPDAVATVAGNLLIALIVIKYEQKSVVSTKVLSFLRKF